MLASIATHPLRKLAWIITGLCLGFTPVLVLGQTQPLKVGTVTRVGDTNLDLGGGFPGQYTNYFLGVGVASLGDLDGDGNVDVVVGARADDDNMAGQTKPTIDNGALYILYLDDEGRLREDLPPRKLSATSPGMPDLDAGPGSEGVRGFGNGIDSLGDFDGDGVVDLVVGNWDDDDGTTGAANSVGFGSVFLLFLNPDGSVKDHQKLSVTQGGKNGTAGMGAFLGPKDFFGDSVSSLGDFDGDGTTDILVGAPGTHKEDFIDSFSGLGRVWILLLNPDGTIKKRIPIDSKLKGVNALQGKLNGASSKEYGDEFGRAVAYLGDLDGDTLDPNDPFDVDSFVTIAVGAPKDDDGPPSPQGRYGAVWLVGLDQDGKAIEVQKISATQGNFNALNQRDLFGSALSPVGDWNHDGIQDLAVGAPRDDDGSANGGAIYILFLNRNGTVKSFRKISETTNGFPGTIKNGSNFGSSVASLGDLDGNGFPDLVVGAELDDGNQGNNVGAAWVVFTEDSRIELGDRVDAQLAPNNRFNFTFEAVKGTKLNMQAVRRPGPPIEPAIRILGPLVDGAEPPEIFSFAASVSTSTKPSALKKAKVKNFELPATGNYLVEVRDNSGKGGFLRLKTKAKIPKDVRSFKTIVDVGIDGEPFPITVTATSTATLSSLSAKNLKPKGDMAAIDGLPAALKPEVDSFVDPDAKQVDVSAHLKTNKTLTMVSVKDLALPLLGDYTVQIAGAENSVGYAMVSVKLKIPKGKTKHVIP